MGEGAAIYANPEEYMSQEYLSGNLAVRQALLQKSRTTANSLARKMIIKSVEQVSDSLRGSTLVERYEALLQTNSKLSRLKCDWDSYSAEPPTLNALSQSDYGIRRAFSLRFLPDAVVPAADGGVAICWDKGEKHAYIQFDNDGSAFSARYEGLAKPVITDIELGDETSLDEQIEIFKTFFA